MIRWLPGYCGCPLPTEVVEALGKLPMVHPGDGKSAEATTDEADKEART